jgi:hypothetical protein
MSRSAAILTLVMVLATPAQAATCTEGLIMLDKTLRKMSLGDDEFDAVTDLMLKAKVEADRGNTEKCVYIVGDIIRLVFLHNARPSQR